MRSKCREQWSARLLIVAVAGATALFTGCSFTMVKGPPPPPVLPDTDFTCTESKAVPAMDGAFATLWLGYGIAGLASDGGGGFEESVGKGGALVATIIGGVTALAALGGNEKVNDCRALRAKLRAIMPRTVPPSATTTFSCTGPGFLDKWTA